MLKQARRSCYHTDSENCTLIRARAVQREIRTLNIHHHAHNPNMHPSNGSEQVNTRHRNYRGNEFSRGADQQRRQDDK